MTRVPKGLRLNVMVTRVRWHPLKEEWQYYSDSAHGWATFACAEAEPLSLDDTVGAQVERAFGWPAMFVDYYDTARDPEAGDDTPEPHRITP